MLAQVTKDFNCLTINQIDFNQVIDLFQYVYCILYREWNQKYPQNRDSEMKTLFNFISVLPISPLPF